MRLRPRERRWGLLRDGGPGVGKLQLAGNTRGIRTFGTERVLFWTFCWALGGAISLERKP